MTKQETQERLAGVLKTAGESVIGSDKVARALWLDHIATRGLETWRRNIMFFRQNGPAEALARFMNCAVPPSYVACERTGKDRLYALAARQFFIMMEGRRRGRADLPPVCARPPRR